VDEEKGVATLKSQQEGVVIAPPRYYIENVKVLLDAPETIIVSGPEFEGSNLKIDAASRSSSGAIATGSSIHLSA
jgi:hypothetical protein